MADLNQNQDAMRAVLANARVIAVVGHSDKPYRTSYRIAQYLRHAGYTVYPVNPTVETINGQPSYASLAEDRKSTRLNSSHVKISYAVFCLKKKIKTKKHSQIQ